MKAKVKTLFDSLKHSLQDRISTANKRDKFVAASIAVGIAMMALTNPSKENYVNYASKQFHEESKSFCTDLNQNLKFLVVTIPTGDTCRIAMAAFNTASRGVIRSTIDSNTHRANLFLFSVYTTDIEMRALGIDTSPKTLAVGGQFITVSR